MKDSTCRGFSWEDLPGFFPGFAPSDHWLTTLRRHAELVEAWRERGSLTAVTAAQAVRRHYAECLEIWRVAVESVTPRRAVDVGTGAGFPGIVAAAVSPHCTWDLVEPLQKRARFLEAAITELGLTNVRLHPARAEDVGRGELREQADVAVARAVAGLPVLLEYAAPLVRLGGVVVLPKGSSAPSEAQAGAAAAEALGLSYEGQKGLRPEVSETPWVLLYRKKHLTPAAYPRRAGVPARRPL